MEITIIAECFSASKGKSGSTITFANQVGQSERGPTARTAVSVQMPDGYAANEMEVGKEYEITIREVKKG